MRQTRIVKQTKTKDIQIHNYYIITTAPALLLTIFIADLLPPRRLTGEFELPNESQ